ncbi:MAG TPA: glycosyltransferase family 4 protein [Chitinophagaceae bacterium]|jgi:glycosyltransferase involved in cell wall biosynthesis|nr:glycosyltransferase family 4 protein [Chitinophagaceae bacterium]
MENLRIAAFGGFRSIPPKAGGAGADKFAVELYPRIVKKGYQVVAYCRIYPGDKLETTGDYAGIELRYFKTVKRAGFDTFLHSFKATFDVIMHNRADVIHLLSGANSIWSIFLRLAGKRVVVSQFAMDWKRAKWPWYGKLFYRVSNYITAYLPNKVVFDNVFTRDYFEKKFKRKYGFIPYGSEVPEVPENLEVLKRFDVIPGEYFLFVGRFIPDKGLHLLIEAFRDLKTDKRLVLVGGDPNPGSYESTIRSTTDKRVVFPGFMYGDDTNILIKNAFAYVQPSLIEGLSPVILTVMGLGTPLICSDIVENLFITGDHAFHFKSGDASDLRKVLEFVLKNYAILQQKAILGKTDVKQRFNWDLVSDQYIEFFTKNKDS